MYGLLWSKLPGPLWFKVLVSVIVVGIVLAILVVWVFPAIDELIVNEEVTI